MKNKKQRIKNFIIDVDGVLTDGTYYYTSEGKIMKKFGPEDNDALSLLKGKVMVHAISGDKRGFSITKKRVADDMKLPLDLVSTFERVDWIRSQYNVDETIYMGDGIYDPLVFKHVAYSIAPANAFVTTKKEADFVTSARGGEGAVAEAVLHILEYFFNSPFDVHSLDLSNGSGAWENKK
jgi:3-deoxy-D-manno-octulosonate 8-phosphate phosphatase (KDO 8-P phosphatase)